MKYEITGVATFFYLFWFIGIWYCIIRYRFLSLGPNMICKDLIENINESVILLDFNQCIIIGNDKTRSLLNCSNIENCDIKIFVHNYDGLHPEIEKILKGEQSEFAARTYFINSVSEKILVDAQFSAVKDSHDDILGIMLISNEVKGIKQLKSFFKITDREAEVILQIITGHCNIRIADELDITENTAKRHITNIYNKLNVNNKLELINLLHGFDLIPKHRTVIR